MRTPSRLPLIGFQDKVRLLRTDNEKNFSEKFPYAFFDDKSWFIPRDESVNLIEIERFLPFFARYSIRPMVVDLIPRTSWFSSLANLLAPSSWRQIREPYIKFHNGCEDCGFGKNLEAHEVWTYSKDEVQSLQRLEILCHLCHETRHLGRAEVNGNFDRAFSRLKSINRILPHESNDFLQEIKRKWFLRSQVQWQIRIPLKKDVILKIRNDVSYQGDGWFVRPAKNGRSESVTRLVDVGIANDGNQNFIVGVSDDMIKDAYS
jgi:hypothetical protein